MIKKAIVLLIHFMAVVQGLSAQNTYEMKSINNNAPVTSRKTIRIEASLEKVWSIMTDIDHWANWQTDISAPKMSGELTPATKFVWKTGGAKIHSTLHTVEPYLHFGWTGKTFGMFAIHNWTLTESDGATIVSVEESMEGLLASLFRKSFHKNLEKGMQNWLLLLKQECETRNTIGE